MEEVAAWLRMLMMEIYARRFLKADYTTLDKCRNLEDSDLDAINIVDDEHREILKDESRMISAVKIAEHMQLTSATQREGTGIRKRLGGLFRGGAGGGGLGRSAAGDQNSTMQASPVPPLKPQKSGDFRAADIAMSDEERIKLMTLVKEGKMDADEALKTVLQTKIEAKEDKSAASPVPKKKPATTIAAKAKVSGSTPASSSGHDTDAVTAFDDITKNATTLNHVSRPKANAARRPPTRTRLRAGQGGVAGGKMTSSHKPPPSRPPPPSDDVRRQSLAQRRKSVKDRRASLAKRRESLRLSRPEGVAVEGISEVSSSTDGVPDLSHEEFLKRLGLERYIDTVVENGYDDGEFLMTELMEDDLDIMEINDRDHRDRILGWRGYFKKYPHGPPAQKPDATMEHSSQEDGTASKPSAANKPENEAAAGEEETAVKSGDEDASSPPPRPAKPRAAVPVAAKKGSGFPPRPDKPTAAEHQKVMSPTSQSASQSASESDDSGPPPRPRKPTGLKPDSIDAGEESVEANADAATDDEHSDASSPVAGGTTHHDSAGPAPVQAKTSAPSSDSSDDASSAAPPARPPKPGLAGPDSSDSSPPPARPPKPGPGGKPPARPAKPSGAGVVPPKPQMKPNSQAQKETAGEKGTNDHSRSDSSAISDESQQDGSLPTNTAAGGKKPVPVPAKPGVKPRPKPRPAPKP